MKKPAVMRYAICGELREFFITGLMFPIRLLSSWECLWNKKYAGKILMKDSYRDAYGTAIIYAHAKELEARDGDGGRTDERLFSTVLWRLAEKYLKALKPNIAGWEADFGKEMMTKNKAWLNMTWSGDAIWAIEEANAVGVDLGLCSSERRK